MSDTTETSTVDTEVDAADATTETQNVDPNPSLVESRDRYRAERDTAREQLANATARVERMQRAEVERLAADGLSHPGDLFSLSGNDLADYLTEDGEVDAEKVTADVAAVLAERPGLRRNSPARDPSQGHGGAPQARRELPTAADLFKQQPGGGTAGAISVSYST